LTRHADMVSTTLNYVTGKNRQSIWLILFFFFYYMSKIFIN
jgi:hypothetical protein